MSHNTPPRPSGPHGDPYGQPPLQGQHQVPPPQPGASTPYGAPPAATPRPPAGHADSESGFFKALFDFSFTTYATPSIVRIIYLVAILFGTLGWLVGAVSMLAAGRGILAMALILLLGWIPLLLWISVLRAGLELVLASVRTAENTRKLREHQGL